MEAEKYVPGKKLETDKRETIVIKQNSEQTNTLLFQHVSDIKMEVFVLDIMVTKVKHAELKFHRYFLIYFLLCMIMLLYLMCFTVPRGLCKDLESLMMGKYVMGRNFRDLGSSSSSGLHSLCGHNQMMQPVSFRKDVPRKIS